MYALSTTSAGRRCQWEVPAAGRGAPPLRSAFCADVFFLSAAAKLGATVVTYPLLLVKARLQSAGKHTSSDRRYTGTADAIERIYRTEGGATPSPPAWLESRTGRCSPLAT